VVAPEFIAFEHRHDLVAEDFATDDRLALMHLYRQVRARKREVRMTCS
jgi:hypothetical protein